MTSVPDAVAYWQQRSCWDGQDEPHRLDWDDPVERAAVALHELSFNTPEEVAGGLTVAATRERIERSWSMPQDHARKARHLYRRRALVVLGVVGGPDAA